MKEQSWTESFDEYEEKDVRLYFVYLKDWFSSHEEGDPVSINEFLDCEMRDDEIAPYYWNLLKEQENPTRLTREQKELVRQAISRAEKSGVPMGDDRLMFALMELATVHYELELDVMLNNSDFDFLQDFMQIPNHFDKKTGTFDDRFIPRFSKRSLN